MSAYPGTIQHQALLEAIVGYYASDERVRAVLLFGSLGEGTWDAFSDLDLDIVVHDAVTIDIQAELAHLSNAPESGALIVLNGIDEGDVVLPSLMQFSIRYHRLADTNPNILRTMRVLSGDLDAASIEAAGNANRRQRQPSQSVGAKVNAYLRHALETDIALQRNRLWMAVELLQRVRLIGMELFTLSRGGIRPVHVFEAQADAELQGRFAVLLHAFDPLSIRTALIAALDLLPALPSLTLTDDQQSMLKRIRARVSDGQ